MNFSASVHSTAYQIPLEESPQNYPAVLYTYNLVTPYYLKNQKIVNLQQKKILDLKCGSGYSTLILAQANPDAEITAIDASATALELAQQRLQYHRINNVEFQVLSLEQLNQLDRQFDYINAENVLDQFADPNLGFQSLKALLKPEGIIRVKEDSAIARFFNYQGRRFFSELGLLNGIPGKAEVARVQEIVRSLKDANILKSLTWQPNYGTEGGEVEIVRNYLFSNTRGFRLSEIFSALEVAHLEFLSMVQWRQWDLQHLFKDIEDLPIFLTLRLAEMSLTEQLQLFELLHPIHQTLEFWCGHPDQAILWDSVSEWSEADWQTAQVHLHPQLRTLTLREEMQRCIVQQQALELSQFLPIVTGPILVDNLMVACLLPLVENALPVTSLVEMWQRLRPIQPLTLEPTTAPEAWETIKQLLLSLEELGYVLLERLP